MNLPQITHGRFDGIAFIPDGPLPDLIGRAELIVFPNPAAEAMPPRMSIFDLFGKAAQLRTGDDIAAQIREERDSWGAS